RSPATRSTMVHSGGMDLQKRPTAVSSDTQHNGPFRRNGPTEETYGGLQRHAAQWSIPAEWTYRRDLRRSPATRSTMVHSGGMDLQKRPTAVSNDTQHNGPFRRNGPTEETYGGLQRHAAQWSIPAEWTYRRDLRRSPATRSTMVHSGGMDLLDNLAVG